jgi:hypothetical protein
LFRRKVIASDPDVARRAGMEAENTKDVPFIRCLMHEYRMIRRTICTYLVIHYDGRASTEATCRTKTVSDRANEHVNLRRLRIFM